MLKDFKFKRGDIVYLSEQGVDEFSRNCWDGNHLPQAIYNGAKTWVEKIVDTGREFQIHVQVEDHGTCFFYEEHLELIPTRKSDAVHNPKHYAVFDDIEAIEVIARSMTQEMFKGYCFGNLLKYRLRVGGKDEVMQELGKADKYKELYEKFKGLCQ